MIVVRDGGNFLICEICGSEVKGKPNYILVDGAKLLVCRNCAKYGPKVVVKESKKEIFPRTTTPRIRRPKQKASHFRTREPELEIVQNYGARIRNARIKLGLSLEDFAKKINEKESWLRKIESNKVQPPIHIARKLERFLGIKLVEVSTEAEIPPVTKHKEITFGDVVDFKKRKK